MGHIFSFADNVSYGAGDINNVISKVVTAVLPRSFTTAQATTRPT